MQPPNTGWVWVLTSDLTLWVASAALAVAGLWLLCWSLFADRSHGRRRCPRCWYDLRGTSGLRCSECGYEARRERQLFRSRRRWKAALCGILVVSCSPAVAVTPQARRDGMLSLVPTWLLVLCSPSAGNCSWRDPIFAELDRRDEVDSLATWEWTWIVQHKDVIKARAKWPKYVPLAIGMKMPAWLGDSRLTVRPRFPESFNASCSPCVGHCGTGQMWTRATARLRPRIVYAWHDGPSNNGFELCDAPILKKEDLERESLLDRWTVRIRGDAEMALTDWDCEKYWAGEFEVPLSHLLK